jgi:hypothetical protein
MQVTINYAQAIELAADLCGKECLDEGLSNEYVRGQCELLGDLFGRPGIELGVRKEEILEELRYAYDHFATPIRRPR